MVVRFENSKNLKGKTAKDSRRRFGDGGLTGKQTEKKSVIANFDRRHNFYNFRASFRGDF
jgi:hypothetical protein